MFQLPGGWEIVIIAVIIIILFSGSRASSTIKKMGQGIYKAKKEVDEIKDLTKK
jgi:Sec-independent protein translocase protein TatA